MDDDDDFGADADFLTALAQTPVTAPSTNRVQQPTPQRVQQPTPQRLDRAPPTNNASAGPKVVQPVPQAIASRSSGSSIQVSLRQKGNPILTNLKSFPWEYSDILADYVLGTTTCALFLSLKYHRLHPEYIYNRIKGLQGKYNLRVLLTMVDIGNHEESLKELSKTSLVNNVTVILCWSALEAARYLELYKSYEHANASAIKGVESKSYGDKMVDFITVPRSINKRDAVALVDAFGSIRGAINARPEEIAVVDGWGEKKVRKWCGVVDEPFRARKAARRGLSRKETTDDGTERPEGVLDRAIPLSRVPLREMNSVVGKSIEPTHQSQNLTEESQDERIPGDDDEEAAILAAQQEEEKAAREKKKELARRDEELSGGVAAALAKLREKH
ncbi:Bcrad10 [Botrytis cinerea B05.10]|uniref:Bcrad10 n=3 Tax=Botryotinia fuckeliana TaxID=40559 RepID=A0A384JVT6_BOTFB|nr:Bcrad10 [Botrytis cinerea B05.10]ATZ54670.1 Bcrad10 [Botrytis cinerea B05.10]EMR87140.1 putative mating-type switching protein swi10 protein [Botrytis cinerea BcDW1]CCD34434.1 similar to mating-type switching protein swi10 [Botrytis cinerea T4]